LFDSSVEFSLETIIERLRFAELSGSYEGLSQIRSTQICSTQIAFHKVERLWGFHHEERHQGFLWFTVQSIGRSWCVVKYLYYLIYYICEQKYIFPRKDVIWAFGLFMRSRKEMIAVEEQLKETALNFFFRNSW